jgi:hypothetical protein
MKESKKQIVSIINFFIFKMGHGGYVDFKNVSLPCDKMPLKKVIPKKTDFSPEERLRP